MTRADQKALRVQNENDWKWLIGHVQGRRILSELMVRGGLMTPIGADNPLMAAFAAGKRDLALQVHNRATQVADSAQLPALLAEVLMPNVREFDARRDRADPDELDAD